MENISIDKLSEGQLASMRKEWDSLLGKSITNEVFLLVEWIYSWWDVFKKGGRELYLLCGKNPMGETKGYINRSSVRLIKESFL